MTAPTIPADALAQVEYRVSSGDRGNVAESLATWLTARWRQRLAREAAERAGDQAGGGGGEGAAQ